jgi:[amino group carrier protein]-lysine/ornithine hydrolase
MDDFETLMGLLSHYSPSGQERAAVEWLVRRMRTLCYDEAFIDEAGNAVGVMGTGHKQVVLLGHIDTVPGAIPVRRDGPSNSQGIPPHEILYGRGAVDAKGPLACFTDAAAQVGRVDGWQFIVIGAVEEERDSDGARYVGAKYKPDYAVIGEPNHWDRVALGYKGSAWANVTLRCGQTHTASGEPMACEQAIELWLKIKAYVESFNGDRPKVFDRLLLSLRGLQSGSDGFEQWAHLSLGVRLPVDVPPEEWYRKLDELAGPAAVEPTGFAVPAWACEKNTPLVRALLHGIRSQGGEPRFVYKTGTADLNIVAPLWKCSALVYGPGDSTLDHTPDEHMSLDEYRKAVLVLREALQLLVK